MSEVILNIYDVTAMPAIGKVNDYIRKLGTGAFHGAVQVFGAEWSYGYIEEGTGVFSCKPQGCDMHHFREPVSIGKTTMSEPEVKKLIEQIQEEWPGTDYDLLRRNCVVFCNEFCQRLGVGPIPGWVTNLAAAGATVQDGAIQVATAAQQAAIIAAAKANEIDQKYNIKGTCQAKAVEFIQAAQGLDAKYHIKENAALFAQQAATTAQAKGKELLQAAKGLDEQYKIRENAEKFGQKAAKATKDAAGVVEQEVRERGNKSGCLQC